MASKLSSGTLNLKFMQRGQPAAKPTPVKEEEWQSVQKGKGKARAAEGDTTPSKRPRVVYETSYASFPILSTKHGAVASNGAGSSSLPPHAGRKSFGRFNDYVERLGQAPVPIGGLPRDDASDVEDDDEFARKAPKLKTRSSPVKPKIKAEAAKPPSASPAVTTAAAETTGFRRPAGFDEVKAPSSQAKPSKRVLAEAEATGKKRARAADFDSSEGEADSDAEVEAVMTGR